MQRKPPSKGLNVMTKLLFRTQYLLFLFPYKQPMDRRVPKNEKYSHVQGTLDTGLTVNKVKAVTAREFAKRRDEIFFRLTKQQLFELYNEYEVDEEQIQRSGLHGRTSNDPRIVTYSEDDEPCYEKPYLVLDVREPDQFQQCHLLHARNYPYTALRRDYVHPDIYKYRNKPEHLIIVYCDDERMSKDAGKLMVDRGIDNVFLLTGGLHDFGLDYPVFMEGELPMAVKARASAASSSSRRGGSTSHGGGGSGGLGSGRQSGSKLFILSIYIYFNSLMTLYRRIESNW